MGKAGNRVATGSLALILTLAGVAGAETISIRVDYSAPAGCPDEAAFLDQVQARLSRARLAGPSELARTMQVTVEREPDRSVARLEFVDADGRQVRREMTGETCAEVASGIALVTALAMDARAHREAPEPSPPVAAPPTPATAKRQPPVAILPPAEPRATSSAGIRVDVGIGLLTTSAVAPTPLYGLGGFVAVGPRRDARSVRLTLAWLDGPTVDVADGRGEASFGLRMARLEACPIAWQASQVLALVPCAAFDAGIVTASGGGSRVPNPETVRLFWPAASAIGRFQFALENLLLLEGQGEIGAPLKQQEFVFEKPDTPVHEVPPVRWGVGLAVGFRFE